DCYTRDWCALEYQVITNPGTASTKLAGFPANNILTQAHTVAAVAGGLIVGGPPASAPLKGTAFRADGTPYAYQYGTVFPNNSTFMYGGEGDNGFVRAPLMIIPVERYNGFVSTSFDFTDTLQSSFELSYGSVQANGRGAQTRDTSVGSVITIRGDNAYLPTAVKSSLTAAGLPLTSATSFVLGRMGDDFGYTDNDSKTEVIRALAGLKGAIAGDWTWDGYYQYGETRYDQVVSNNRIQQQVAGVPLVT